MNIKVRRPRSCLGWMLWVSGALVVFVLIYNVYAQVRIYMAREQAMTLAQQLGLKTDNLLRDRINVSDVSIVTGSASCSVELYFVTSLELSGFEAHLLRLQPGTRRVNPGTGYLNEIYSVLPLIVNGVSGKQPGARETFPHIPTVSWFLPGGTSMDASIVDFYQTVQVPANLQFRERRINGNIVVIDWTAGRYPIWVDC
jgi:hypothetical protein